MGNILAYSGIATKVKSMQSKLLSEDKLREMAALENVPEALEYLKRQPAYEDLFSDVDDQSFHRSAIEQRLLLSKYRDFTKLYRFSRVSQRKFLDLYFLHYEIAILKRCLRCVLDHRNPDLDLSLFQEFFEKLRNEPERWGKPFSALLGTVDAQLELGAAAIGGKDSMSGTFLDLDVPPTLISFAIAPLKTGEVLSPEFKEAGHPVYLFSGTDADSVKAAWERLHALALAGKVRAAWAVENGLAEAVMKMSFGNEIGFTAENADLDWNTLCPGAIVAELTEDTAKAVRLGVTTAEPVVRIADDSAPISELLALNEGVLESVYPSRTAADPAEVPVLSAPAAPRTAPKAGVAVPKVLIPVFPGTNCEYDSARAVQRAGLEPEILVMNNQSAQGVADSISRFAKAARDSQIIFVPGGFSGGDEPDGSAKFITAFFRNPEVRDAAMDLLKNRDGLMLGICNGFQALIKLGLVPYGEIINTDETCPTLTFNTISRHQSRLVRTRIASNRSPWLAGTQVGDIYTVPISHGEGRFLCSEELVRKLADNGQIVTQYVDEHGVPGMDVDVNPNGSIWAVEGIMSPDGRVLGKMGHSERVADGLYKNVDGCYDMKLFQSAKKYFDI